MHGVDARADNAMTVCRNPALSNATPTRVATTLTLLFSHSSPCIAPAREYTVNTHVAIVASPVHI